MNEPNITPSQDTPDEKQTTPLRCIIGATISSALAFAAYSLMMAIATSFANKPIHSNNPIVLNISSAVRTLVVGIMALGTGVFGIVALGLLTLGMQLLLQQLKQPKNS
ncbi:DUF3082 domain-containing protein [Sphaerospermopsis aphanizomenoides BCCUSP55]|uniref:DUF3082 domain-containing protein n=1 Tax=Sphaerospermopsis aphanizomenoides TaxID=459663 RepID=UPI001908572E|nr:DUF3082 domain-containing protein [Sphaerospermopsis aphanizomenoides]MBK1986527.1 DUF3082 domain-containing protein [Sphaerospermopsis aphanizomenoides BCCUSP55]